MLGTLSAIPAGDAGTWATLAMMRRLARAGALDGYVRRTAARLVTPAGRNERLHCLLIRNFCTDRTRYLNDPSHAEALHEPATLLAEIDRRGIVGIDCDDVALLAAALALSIGLRARFMVAGFSPPPSPFQHVWTDVAGRRTEWIAVDPTRPMQPPRITRLVAVEV